MNSTHRGYPGASDWPMTDMGKSATEHRSSIRGPFRARAERNGLPADALRRIDDEYLRSVEMLV